ncbi:MAG: hypothetical protein KZQ77_05195 [Candidatus Thiodiazotropha sp. (ex Notomyrtea botanica)]|nr:hypothetical protein [Candidatus Thiodiazotropha sp. (ex Notomyrtea botanica)]
MITCRVDVAVMPGDVRTVLAHTIKFQKLDFQGARTPDGQLDTIAGLPACREQHFLL